jgi:hypothetical protein
MDIYLQIADKIKTEIGSVWPYSYEVGLKQKIYDIIDENLTADTPPNQVNRPGALKCHCRGDKTCIFCGADMDKLNE